MAISWSDVVAVAPELSTAAAATQAYLLDFVDRMVDDDVWGEFADDGRAYLAAHLATIGSGSGGGSGAVLSETIGPLSRTYANVDTDNSGLSTTKYGVFYLTLVRMAVAVPALVP